MTRILFVCLGNICRSPTAEGVIRKLAKERGLSLSFDSAGTGDYHIGEPPYGPMRAAAKKQGYDLSDLRARQFTAQDYFDFDLIIAMDNSNVSNMERLRPDGVLTPVKLLLDYHPSPEYSEVPDPYYTREFDLVIDLIERAGTALLEDISQ